MKNYKVRLSSEELVFSSAHFITYANGECESLHGHDFRVSLEVSGELDTDGNYVIDFLQLKKNVKEILRGLDHKILLQSENPHMHVSVQEAEPAAFTDDVQSWVSKVGNWLSQVNDYDLPEKSTEGDVLDRERELETHLSRELGLIPPATPPACPSNMIDSLHAEVEVAFQHRRWIFPEEDCVILPIANTTAELLAEYIAAELLKKPILADRKLQRLTVQIDESNGTAGVFEQNF